MTLDELKSFYQKRKNDFSITLASIKEKINVISNLRIIVALAFLVVVYFAFSNTILFSAAVPLLIVFTVLVLRHGRLYDQKIHLENLVKICHLEEQALKGDISSFASGDSL